MRKILNRHCSEASSENLHLWVNPRLRDSPEKTEQWFFNAKNLPQVSAQRTKGQRKSSSDLSNVDDKALSSPMMSKAGEIFFGGVQDGCGLSTHMSGSNSC
jgi:hypothetical protein